jgi:hypothetical protein
MSDVDSARPKRRPVVSTSTRTARRKPDGSQTEGGVMPRRKVRAVGAALIVASMALTGVALATSSTGSIVVQVHGAGSLDQGAGFAMTPGSNTVVATLTFGPHSSTGWHTHPGKTLVLVKSGTFTVYHARDCEPRVYGPGTRSSSCRRRSTWDATRRVARSKSRRSSSTRRAGHGSTSHSPRAATSPRGSTDRSAVTTRRSGRGTARCRRSRRGARTP